MVTELLDGYFIEATRTGNHMLKQKYTGIRGGKEAECYRIISHHRNFEDAAKAFLRLFRVDKTDKRYESIESYVKSVIQANVAAVDAIQRGNMYRFYVNRPQAKGKSDIRSIVDYIPVGRNNAIPRKSLVLLAAANGLVDKSLSEAAKDRETRRLIEIARRDYVILNLSNGQGYYRASREDAQDLQRYIRQEESRGKATFRNISMARKLYEDYRADRL